MARVKFKLCLTIGRDCSTIEKEIATLASKIETFYMIQGVSKDIYANENKIEHVMELVMVY